METNILNIRIASYNILNTKGIIFIKFIILFNFLINLF
jgi:hypothetical protein